MVLLPLNCPPVGFLPPVPDCKALGAGPQQFMLIPQLLTHSLAQSVWRMYLFNKCTNEHNQWRLSYSARFSNPTGRQQNQTSFLYSVLEKFLLAALFLPKAAIRLKVPEFMSPLSLCLSFHFFWERGRESVSYGSFHRGRICAGP